MPPTTKRAKQPKAAGRHAARNWPWRSWLAGGVLVILVALVYWPTLHNGFVWDDPEYVENNLSLRTSEGLSDIWLKFGATPQYYPLVHTAFWAEYHLWGLDPRGYHAVNVLLHAVSAVLVWRLLTRLAVPEAWLAAAIFAVHPVMVESVAWVTERKNVLSLALALGSILAYLRFSPPAGEPAAASASTPSTGRAWGYYALALVLFVAALLSKTVTASVPAVLLVFFWWKRGRLTWRGAANLAPFFALGMALAGVTVWLESTHVGASGEEWNLSPLARVLVAGRALWFYAGKLLVPYPLIFFYPRWSIDTSAWWQYLFPLGVLAELAALWWARKYFGRGPLAASLIFAGVLLPALGFVNVYPFRYSFVADHFQYHASVALIALAAAGLVYAWRLAVPAAADSPAANESKPAKSRRRRRATIYQHPLAAPLAAALLLAALGFLANRRTLAYENQGTLYRDTIARNPTAWVAHQNLAGLMVLGGNYRDAITHYRRTIQIRDKLAQENPALGHYQDGLASDYANLAIAQKESGAAAAAVTSQTKALAIRERLVQERPDESLQQDKLAACHVDLATIQSGLGQTAEAERSMQHAIEIRKKLTESEPAAINYQASLAATYTGLAILYETLGQFDQAVAANDQAITLRQQLLKQDGTSGVQRNALGWNHTCQGVLLAKLKRPAEAVASSQQSVDIRQKLVADEPQNSYWQAELARSYSNLGITQLDVGRAADALASFDRSLELREKLAAAAPNNSEYGADVVNSFVRRGDALAALGQWRESAQAFGQAERRKDTSVSTLARLALAQVANNDAADYRTTCTKLYETYNTNAAPDVRMALAFVIFFGNGALADMSQATAIATRAAEADPTNPLGPVLIGAAQLRANRAAEATKTLRAALERLPSNEFADSPPELVDLARLLGQSLIVTSLKTQNERDALDASLKTLRELADKKLPPGQRHFGWLPPWTFELAVEMAQRQLREPASP